MNLWCVVFGHRFVAKKFWSMTGRRKRPYRTWVCTRCRLVWMR